MPVYLRSWYGFSSILSVCHKYAKECILETGEEDSRHPRKRDTRSFTEEADILTQYFEYTGYCELRGSREIRHLDVYIV